VVKTLTYDAINRPLTVQYSDGTAPVTYAYATGVDRIASITEGPATPAPANSQAFIYDNLGGITSVTQYIDQVPYVTQYSYNLLGQLATITYPSGHVYTQSYDAVGRLASIANGANTYLSGLSYNAAGETLGLTMGNGVQGAFTYNDHLQLASLRYFKSGITPDPLNLAYDYTSATQPNNNGQIQAMHYYTQPGTEDTNKSESFTYDSWFRLKATQTINVNSSTAGTWSLAWTYDRLGNRKQQQLTGGNLPAGIGQPNFTIDESTNQISGFTYDLAGNLTNDGAFTYAYDGANRMKQAQQSASPNTVTSSTFFGPLRIKKAVGSTTTVYVYSGAKPIAEYVNGSLSKEYIYAGSALLATIAGTSTTYHHPDHLSNRAETDSTGAVVRTAGHFPYGESWYESSADPMKFTTYSRDSGTGETGSDYAMFRQFNSGQGRFMSADILAGNVAAPQSANRYSYTGNDPINFDDPLGLDQVGVSISGNCITTTYYGFGYVGGTLVGGEWRQRFGSIKEGSSTFCFPSAGGGSIFGTAGGGGNGGGAGRTRDTAGHQDTCIFLAALAPDARTGLESARNLARLSLGALDLQDAHVNSVAVGIGGGAAAGLAIGPAWSIGRGFSGSTLVGADNTGSSGLLISFAANVPAGLATIPTWGGGAAANIGFSVLASPKTLDGLAGPSWGASGSYGPVAADITSNGVQATIGLGVGARFGLGFSFGPSVLLPFCD
jgi:RHS repeat-associated protein